MNLVAVIGNACDKPTAASGEGKTSVARLRIAVSRTKSDEADFFTIVAFGKTAEVLAEYVTKGRRIACQGRLHHSSYETDSGEKRSTVEIIADRIHLLGAGR
jgi:single-strand DNA-binding protein